MEFFCILDMSCQGLFRKQRTTRLMKVPKNSKSQTASWPPRNIKNTLYTPKGLLGGCFKYEICFIFTPWEMIQFDEHIFSDELVQPPTSLTLVPETLPSQKGKDRLPTSIFSRGYVWQRPGCRDFVVSTDGPWRGPSIPGTWAWLLSRKMVDLGGYSTWNTLFLRAAVMYRKKSRPFVDHSRLVSKNAGKSYVWGFLCLFWLPNHNLYGTPRCPPVYWSQTSIQTFQWIPGYTPWN